MGGWSGSSLGTFRRVLVAAIVLFALVSSATTVQAAVAHTLIVAVRANVPRAPESKLAVLILITQDGGAPAGAVATARRPLTIALANSGSYRIHAEIDASCRGRCDATHRISGSTGHKVEIVPSCQPAGSGFTCNGVSIVEVY